MCPKLCAHSPHSVARCCRGQRPSRCSEDRPLLAAGRQSPPVCERAACCDLVLLLQNFRRRGVRSQNCSEWSGLPMRPAPRVVPERSVRSPHGRALGAHMVPVHVQRWVPHLSKLGLLDLIRGSRFLSKSSNRPMFNVVTAAMGQSPVGDAHLQALQARSSSWAGPRL